MAAVRVIISGHVQGVGFRYFVVQEARSIGIGGEVWNRNDYAVEVHAEHPDPALLQQFIDLLWEGPGSVKDVATEPAVERGFVDFRISRGT